MTKSTQKTLRRPLRLQSAKDWIATYTGKNLVRGYRKRFGVDLLTAIAELKILGVVIDPAYQQAARQTVCGLIEARAKMKEVQKTSADCQSEDFAYIIGYTSGGAPYGLRWEDLPSSDED